MHRIYTQKGHRYTRTHTDKHIYTLTLSHHWLKCEYAMANLIVRLLQHYPATVYASQLWWRVFQTMRKISHHETINSQICISACVICRRVWAEVRPTGQPDRRTDRHNTNVVKLTCMTLTTYSRRRSYCGLLLRLLLSARPFVAFSVSSSFDTRDICSNVWHHSQATALRKQSSTMMIAYLKLHTSNLIRVSRIEYYQPFLARLIPIITISRRITMHSEVSEYVFFQAGGFNRPAHTLGDCVCSQNLL